MLFVRVEKVGVNRVKVYWRAGQRFKIHELAVFVLFALAADNKVLGTDTVAAFNLTARRVAGYHARFIYAGIYPLRHHLPAEAVGAFVHVQQIAHAVACAVLIIKPFVP